MHTRRKGEPRKGDLQHQNQIDVPYNCVLGYDGLGWTELSGVSIFTCLSPLEVTAVEVSRPLCQKRSARDKVVSPHSASFFERHRQQKPNPADTALLSQLRQLAGRGWLPACLSARCTKKSMEACRVTTLSGMQGRSSGKAQGPVEGSRGRSTCPAVQLCHSSLLACLLAPVWLR